jgi:hypothetical protein
MVWILVCLFLNRMLCSNMEYSLLKICSILFLFTSYTPPIFNIHRFLLYGIYILQHQVILHAVQQSNSDMLIVPNTILIVKASIGIQIQDLDNKSLLYPLLPNHLNHSTGKSKKHLTKQPVRQANL